MRVAKVWVGVLRSERDYEVIIEVLHIFPLIKHFPSHFLYSILIN